MGATQPLLIIAKTGLPQAERQGPCVYLYIPVCMHATAVHVWYSVDISVLVSLYVSSMDVCPSPCLPIHNVCTHLTGYNIQNPFIKVMKQAFIAPVCVSVNVCMNVSAFMCAFIYMWLCFVYVLFNRGYRSSGG